MTTTTQMGWHKSSLLAALIATSFGPNLSAQQTATPNQIFKPALSEIRGQHKVPILLPTTLPKAIRTSAIKLAKGFASERGYEISLYYGKSANSSFAAYFSGTREALPQLQGETPVRLGSGARGIFRPVSCGGSCAPANLWWQQGEATYQIQIKLDSAMPEAEQGQILMEIANSSVAAEQP